MSETRAVRVVAVIPARGGSKGVPGKNLRPVGGVPLVVRAIRACRGAGVAQVCVSTDDAAIAEVARRAGAGVIERPVELAGDQASSESALLHALDHLSATEGAVDVLVFVQATSPFIDPVDLAAGVELVTSGAADSVFSGLETYEFLWRDADPSAPAGSGALVGQNHDPRTRPRRQDRRPDFRETGAFYVLAADGFRAARHRFFGRVRVVSVRAASAIEIDEPDDLVLADALAARLDPGSDPTTTARGLPVDAVLTDFDGVHTDDRVSVDQHGVESVVVSRSDGLGVGRLRAAGVPLVIVSKERNPVVAARAAKLGVEALQGIDDKRGAVAELLRRDGLDPSRVAYLGNDVNDLEAMALVGWPVAVADAHPQVRAAARLVLSAAGGHGAVRELCDLVLAHHTPTDEP